MQFSHQRKNELLSVSVRLWEVGGGTLLVWLGL